MLKRLTKKIITQNKNNFRISNINPKMKMKKMLNKLLIRKRKKKIIKL